MIDIKEMLLNIQEDDIGCYNLASEFLINEFNIRDIPFEILYGLKEEWAAFLIRDLIEQYEYELCDVPLFLISQVLEDRGSASFFVDHLLKCGYDLKDIPEFVIDSMLKYSDTTYRLIVSIINELIF